MTLVAGQQPFLGVGQSAGGNRWQLRLPDDRTALAIAQRHGIPDLVARVIAGRGVSVEQAGDYLEPTLRVLMPDPSSLADMDVAADRVASAIVGGEQIAVFGDYDVDGATSSALIARYLRALGRPCRIYVPDRVKEGYGPNTPALERLREEGAALVITVDCGISAHAPLTAARDMGLDVIVVDHHIAEPALPPAVAVVNPNRLDDGSGQGTLAAVGVAFLLVVAVNRRLRDAGHFRERPEPDLRGWLDLVALGTVCDMVPLTGLNRALVRRGLAVMARRNNVGLAALADVAGSDAPPDANLCGFILGPRINAGGRVGTPDLGYRLLTADDPEEAQEIARRLDRHNAERRAIEAAGLDEALALAHDQVAGAGDAAMLVAAGAWHPGVVGLIASRLTEKFGRPSLVIALDGAHGKGSARSVAGIDIGAAVTAARQAGLLINGGGHAMAAGVTVEQGKIDALRDFLEQRVSAVTLGPPSLELDGAVAVAGATLDLVEMLGRAGPFGSGNPGPRFAVSGARIVDSRVVKEQHVRVVLADGGGTRLTGMAFRAADGPVGALLRDPGAGPVHVAGRLEANRWRGRSSVQLLVDDAAPAR